MLNTTFTKAKINKITDKGVQQILLNHISKFDTIKLPFEEAIIYYEALLEKEEFDTIINNNEKNINSPNDLFQYLREHNFKYDKSDYTNLNIFINKVPNINFRNQNLNNGSVTEHPEIAFTPEAIEK